MSESSVHGTGLFATAAIPARSTIWELPADTQRYHQSDISGWAATVRDRFFVHAHSAGDGWYYGFKDEPMTDDGGYMNHSCDPNVWFESDDVIVARRHISPGEEILYDYAMSEAGASHRLACRCGTSLCRGVVLGSDFQLIPELRERYAGHVMSHVAAATWALDADGDSPT